MLDKSVKDKLIKELNGYIDDDQMALAKSAERLKKFSALTTVICNAVKSTSFCKFNDCIHFFNGYYYEPIGREEFEYILFKVMDIRQIDKVYSLRNSIFKMCMVDIVGNVVSKIPNNLVCFKNGVVNFDKINLVDFDIKAHNSKFSVFYMLPYNFDLKADCPMWKKFLNEVLPTKELQKNLQEFLGLIFCNRQEAKIETMLWLYGSGANGKGVVYETIMGILGKDNVTNFDLSDLISGSAKERNIASINGKPLNYSPDLDAKDITSESAKRIISGESTPARNLYGSPFMASNIPLIMANVNRLPKNNDKSSAWTRRIRVIPFNVIIPEDKRDQTLSVKLRTEYPGILNWILEGRKRIIAQNYKFTPCRDIDDCLSAYQRDNNTVVQFVEFNGLEIAPLNEFDKGQVITTSNLYFRYKEWCGKSDIPAGERFSPIMFSKEISKMGFIKTRTSEGTKFRYFGRSVN